MPGLAFALCGCQAGRYAVRFKSDVRPFTVLASIWMLSGTAAHSEVLQDTYLLDVYAGSARSDLAASLRSGGYELSGGNAVNFDDWYKPRLPDLTVLLFSELSPNFGISWGLSSGEVAQKYKINPALHVGFTVQTELFANATLSLTIQTLLGGRLREKSCTADYEEEGISEVNCRLAASLLPPEETLNYLLDVSAQTETRITLRLQYSF